MSESEFPLLEEPNEKEVINEIKNKEHFIPNYTKSVFKCECLSAKFGDCPIYQEEFSCNVCCGNNLICKYCSEHCHKNCPKSSKPVVTRSHFVCACALKIKHIPLPSIAQKKTLQIDDANKEEIVKEILNEPSKINTYSNFSSILSNIAEHLRELNISYVGEIDLELTSSYNLGNTKFELYNVLELDKLVNFMQWTLSLNKNELTIHIIDSLIAVFSIISIYHVKQDFRTMKKVTVDDYLNCQISQLYHYKENISSEKNTFVPFLYNKYFKDNTINKIVQLYCKGILLLIEKNRMNMTLLVEFFHLINHCCEYMLLDYNSIESVVEIIEKTIEDTLKCTSEKIVIFYIRILDCSFMMGQLYNVLVSEDYIKTGSSDHNNIFYDNKIGSSLLNFMLSVQNAYYLCIMNEDGKDEASEHFLFFEKIGKLFCFPFKGMYRPFNRELFDLNYLTKSEQYQQTKTTVDQINNLTFDIVLGETNHKDIIDKMNTILTQYKEYIKSKIKVTDTIKYRNLKHVKAIEKIQKSFDLGNNYIKNVDEILDELMYCHLDTAITKLLCQCYKQINFEDSENSVTEKSFDILYLFLLSNRGIQFFCLGENIRFIFAIIESTISSNSTMNTCKNATSFLFLLPKLCVEKNADRRDEMYSIWSDDKKESNYMKIKMFIKVLKKGSLYNRLKNILFYIPECNGSKIDTLLIDSDDDKENENKSREGSEQNEEKEGSEENKSREERYGVDEDYQDINKKIEEKREKIEIERMKNNKLNQFMKVNYNSLDKEEKFKYKFFFRCFEALSKFPFIDTINSFLLYLELDTIKNIFKSSFLSDNKKRILIRTMTFYYLSEYFKKPLTNKDYAVSLGLSVVEKNKIQKQGVKDESNDQIGGNQYNNVGKEVKHIKYISMLIKIITYELKKISVFTNTNSKEYFQKKKLYKEILKSIMNITLYMYNYVDISNMLLYPFFKMLNVFLHKEEILLNLFELKVEPYKEIIEVINKKNFDCFNKAQQIEIMLKEIHKFYPIIRSKKYESVYSLFLKNNNNNLFNNNESPFSFLVNPQNNNNALLYVEDNYYSNQPNFNEYKARTIEQINDASNNILIDAFDTDAPAKFVFLTNIVLHFCNSNFVSDVYSYENVFVMLYKIGQNNLKEVIEQFEDENEKGKRFFFQTIKRRIKDLLFEERALSKNSPNLEYETYLSFHSVMTLKFLELFGEGFNFKFHKYILNYIKAGDIREEDPDDKSFKSDSEEEEPEDDNEDDESTENESKEKKLENILTKNKHSIFEIVLILLHRNIKDLMKKEQYLFTNPYDDNALIVVTSQIQFLIEFFYTLNQKNERFIDNSMEWLIKRNIHSTEQGVSLFNILMNPKKLAANKSHLFLKSKILDLLNAYFSSGNKNTLVNYIYNHTVDDFTLLSYYKEIIKYFDNLTETSIEENNDLKYDLLQLKEIKDDKEYTRRLLDLYIWKEEFRKSWQMSLMIKLFLFISIIEKNYGYEDVQELLEDFDKEKYKQEEIAQSLGIYNFLKQICRPIEINYMVSDEEKNDLVLNDEQKEIKIVCKQLPPKDDDNRQTQRIYQKIQKVNVKPKTTLEEVIQEKYNTTFFIVPYYAFFLSLQSKLRFEETVDRSSKTTKGKGLISSIELFLFEMIVNKYNFKNNKLSVTLSKINYLYFEIINFLVIIIHNLILLVHYYKSWKLPNEEYAISEEDNFNVLSKNSNWKLAVLQMIYLLCVLALWFKFNFILCFFKNLQEQEDGKNSVFERAKVYRELYNNEAPNFFSVIDEQFSEISLAKKIKIGIVDSFILNGEVAIFILTFLCLLLYLCVRSPIFLVIPVLFIAHIFETILSVFQGIYSRFKHLFAVYIFTFLVIYIFMWFGFLFFGNVFSFTTVNPNNEELSTVEPFCTSSIQCLLFFLNFGIRSGGGIGDMLNMASFKDNYSFYLKIFFFEIFFHLCIVMIFANVFLGLIADAFGELREVAWAKENDKNNICFICQIDSDTCGIKGIDYEEHVKETHNLWYYVYFLCYLYMKDENEYNIMEHKIMTSINELNISWIPFAGNDDD